MGTVFDLAVVGGGIVGLATARTALARHPSFRVCLLEKEDVVGRHQTGHNSGVIHSGAYYRPGSAKARMCLRGRSLLIEYCESHGIAHRRVGKLIVATSPTELPALATIESRAKANGVPGVVRLAANEIARMEPEIRGIVGLHVPTAEIVDYKSVCRSLASDIGDRGGEVRLSSELRSVSRSPSGVILRTEQEEVQAKRFVNCGGLQSDRVARMAGVNPAIRIVPFRGEYYWVRPERGLQLSHLIYPVPDPSLPFLGVHLTLDMQGRIEAGPNAVLAGAREGYRRTTVNLRDLSEMLADPGFWAMARRLWRVALYEQIRSVSRGRYARDLQRLAPGLSASDLAPGGAGVRAQAVDREGRLVDDFVLSASNGALHVLNAPSPAATSSLAIAEEVLDAIGVSA